jgi:zinc transport system ATP-binding protein
MDDVVRLKDVDFAYNGISILRKVNLALKGGEFVAVIGPNGGGKTTLLKLIAGLLKPDRGQILACDEIGYVPQALPFDRRFPISVMELVLTGTLSHLPWHGAHSKKSKERARAALDRVGLIDKAQLPFGTLSGGQMQRVLIARALVDEPKLLLLDEPTANIDIEATKVLKGVLQSLRGQVTIAMVTHDLGTAIHDVDRVICVQNEVYGLSPDQVCEHFAVGLYHTPLLAPEEKS